LVSGMSTMVFISLLMSLCRDQGVSSSDQGQSDSDHGLYLSANVVVSEPRS